MGSATLLTRTATALVAIAVSIVPLQAQLCGNTKAGCGTVAPLIQIQGAELHAFDTMMGGALLGRVVVEPPRADGVVRKHLAPSKAREPLTLRFSGVNEALIALIDALLGGIRVSFDVVMRDANLALASWQHVTDADVVSVSTRLDVSSKQPCMFRVELRVDDVRDMGTANHAVAPIAGGTKQCQAGRFRVALGDEAIEPLTIDSLVLRRAWPDGAAGPGQFDFPNLLLAVARNRSRVLSEWYDDFVLRAANGDERERTLSVSFLPPTSVPPALLELTARGVGVVARRSELGPLDPLRFELYVEEWDRPGRSHPPGTPRPANPPPGPGGDGTGGGAAGTPPRTSTGTFRVSVPEGGLNAAGVAASFCREPLFVLTFVQEGFRATIGGITPPRRGTHPIIEDTASGKFSLTITSENPMRAYLASSGALTITQSTETRLVGRFSAVARIEDSDRAKDVALTGTFDAVAAERC